MNDCELQIDVSVAQGPNLDFARMFKAGATRAAIRIVNGNDGKDACALQNVTRAQQAGMKVEGYVACFPLPPKYGHANRDPQGQCDLFIAESLILGLDDEIIWLDVEWPPISDNGHMDDLQHWNQTPRGVRDWVVEATSYLKSRGMRPGIYGYPYYLTALGLDVTPELAEVPLWIANYGVQAPSVPPPWSDWMAWQHTDKGTLDGCHSLIDLSFRRIGT